MSVPVPPAPPVVRRRPRVIQQTRRGTFLGWAAVVFGSIFVFVLLERAFGINGPVSNQAWIIPISLVAAVAGWRRYQGLGPKIGSEDALVVTPDRLEYHHPGLETIVVERPSIALIEVNGNSLSGLFVLVVYDDRSTVLGDWTARWSGWPPERVVRVLRKAGYPAARHSDIYDGTFQEQVLGQPPRMAH